MQIDGLEQEKYYMMIIQKNPIQWRSMTFPVVEKTIVSRKIVDRDIKFNLKVTNISTSGAPTQNHLVQWGLNLLLPFLQRV